jgi:hypothetical protein
MYLLSAEKQRLEQELAHLDERRRRIWERLKGIATDLLRSQQVAQQEEASGRSDGFGLEATAEPDKLPSRHWRTMPLEY